MAAAALAAQADVGAQAVDQPRVAAARMGAPKPDDVAEEQREDGRSVIGRVRVSKPRVAVDRDEVRSVAGSSSRSIGVTVDDDVGLGRRQLGDDPAGPGQRAGQLLRRADRLERRTGRRAAAPSTVAAPGAPTDDDARARPGRRRRAIASAPALRSSLIEVLEARAVDRAADRDRHARARDRVEAA